MSTVEVDLDFIEELRLRRWARQNYVPPEQRDVSWHPVVLDENGSQRRRSRRARHRNRGLTAPRPHNRPRSRTYAAAPGSVAFYGGASPATAPHFG